MARALITGAGGFIGQHLSLALMKSGWDVRGIGRSAQPRLLNGIEWMTGDVLDQSFDDTALTGSDVVIHLACLPLRESAEDPVLASRINTEGTLKVLEAARRSGVKRFVFTSTSQVYGGGSPLPNKESDVPRPDSAYAASKYAAEIWCEAYRHRSAMSVLIMRLFNVYGLSADGTPRSTVETLFLQQIRDGRQPVITGSPQSGRDFIHIDDVVHAIELALSGNGCGGPVNIGTGTITTLGELAHLAAEIYGKPKTFTSEGNDMAMYRLCADQTLAFRLMNFQTKIKLNTGLREIAALIG